MATFDYATPIWADDTAHAVVNMQTLGRLASTITDITMSLQVSSAVVLPKQASDGVDYTYGDLLFLQRYVFSHMSLMDQRAREDLAAAGFGSEYVFVHTGWLRQIADVMLTMAHHVGAGRFATPRIQVQGQESPTPQDWINNMVFQAEVSVKMADDVDGAA